MNEQEQSALVQWITSSPEQKQWYLRETLKVGTSEMIWERMEIAGVSKTELAKRLGVSKPEVTRLLNGSRNMTLEKLSDIAQALGYRAAVVFVELPEYLK
jgi:antitoxin component HigA of HigAB toxin-antitoxin module